MEEMVVAGCAVSPVLISLRKIAEFDFKHGGLNGVEAAVPADLVVEVTACHSVGTKRSRSAVEFRTGSSD